MYGPICIFSIYYPISILNYILYSHSPILLSTLCKYSKPAIPVDYCRKVDKSVKKRFSHQEVGKSSEKRGFYISLPKKCLLCIMPYFAPLWTSLDHLCITLYTYRIYCNTISLLYFICNDFLIFYYLLSQLFGFSSAILFSISIYCGFASFYHYAALVVPFCTWLCFFLFSFALFM